MSEPGRPFEAASRQDGERQRFLRRVCAVTQSRQISWTTLTDQSAKSKAKTP
ncbi:hypothetical protein GCM10022243_07400 [Saccharothrix violaceirubra]|uniref:Uncharacterized protein n=1 Tax=Saccharothrix violaceirubra TaxID=413306 RepID=A0A7W7WTW8_9PSEU|nr:hypothetical protein [Saccharothrix violaceirubra]MBB4963152.1 hypothetical protein [Saccharothrix violaceirubra]